MKHERTGRDCVVNRGLKLSHRAAFAALACASKHEIRRTASSCQRIPMIAPGSLAEHALYTLPAQFRACSHKGLISWSQVTSQFLYKVSARRRVNCWACLSQWVYSPKLMRGKGAKTGMRHGGRQHCCPLWSKQCAQPVPPQAAS